MVAKKVKKVKHRVKKAASNKKPHAPKAAVRHRRMAAKGLALGPPRGIYDAAYRAPYSSFRPCRGQSNVSLSRRSGSL